ncbi:methyltransferase type 11 [Afipia sp. P52-10]|jgi:SAM-dependent methyltransferase|nr:methyltransferase type 11 [Afipia sp. P52-10]
MRNGEFREKLIRRQSTLLELLECRTQSGEPAAQHGFIMQGIEFLLDVKALLCCPRCRSALDLDHDPIRCTNTDCHYTRAGFPRASGQPVLIDFDRSIFDRAAYADDRGSVMKRDDTGRGMAVRLRRMLTGANPVTPEKSREMVIRLLQQAPNPLVLVIGGGAIGAGADPLYATGNIRVIGTDVYASANTDVVADGHFLPFQDAVFDGVWIQAVLEHVLDPSTVVAEIHRVLKPGGVVYADTPFIQQVHEQAYDFTRFTLSGHRWLFRHFEEIDSGAVGGAGKALVWSIRYVALSLGLSTRLATLVALPFFWVRFIDRFARPGPKSDAASGVYFFGRRSDRTLQAKDMLRYYEMKR